MPTLRAVAKAAGERAFRLARVDAVLRMRHRGDVVILGYHNVVPDGVAAFGDAPLHLPVSQFAAQLDFLSDTHDVITLSEALAGGAARHRRPCAVVTFDDAYRGALTLGAGELRKRGMPATVFVAPAFVGGSAFWWDTCTSPALGAFTQDFRRRAIDDCAGRQDAVLALASRLRAPVQHVPQFARCATEAELGLAVRSGVFTVGSHSWSHPNLARITGPELRDELARPLAWLRERFEKVLPVIAYPYGRSSGDVVSLAREVGYEAGLRNFGGWLSAGRGDVLFAPRCDVPAGLSVPGFALRAAGLFAG